MNFIKSTHGKPPFIHGLLCAAAMLLILSSSAARAQTPANIPDANLKTAIRQATGIATGTIYDTDMANLTKINAPSANISDLTGLEYCVNLQELQLANNQISNITPISDLTDLTTLSLSHNPLSILSPLSNLLNLQVLDLAYIQATALDSLSGLTKMKELYLNNNSFSDTSPLSGMTSLVRVNLNSNSLSSFVNLPSMESLRYIHLADNQLWWISGGWAFYTSLGSDDWVDLSDNPLLYDDVSSTIPTLRSRGATIITNALGISTVSPGGGPVDTVVQVSEIIGSGFKPGTAVYLKKNGQTTITATSVVVLDSTKLSCDFDLNEAAQGLWNVFIRTPDDYYGTLNKAFLVTDGTSLFNAPVLESAVRTALNKTEGVLTQADLLSLTNFAFQGYQFPSVLYDITGLEHCKNITSYLFLTYTRVSDITPLSSMTKLKELYIYSNQIIDISPLSGMKDLEVLYLLDNKVSDITAVAQMTNLKEIYLGRNNVTNLSPVSELTSLTLFEATENNISDISPLSNLKNLEELYLSDNSISNIAALSECKKLIELSLRRMQISDITPLANVTNLNELDLGVNDVADISVLSNLKNLHEIRLDSNQISNIDALTEMSKLNTLYINKNDIVDLSPLLINTNFTNESHINANNNPLDLNSITSVIPQLKATGATVEYNALSVLSLTPSSALPAAAVQIDDLQGIFFASGVKTVQLRRVGYAAIVATSVVINNDNSLSCVFDLSGAATGLWNVFVRNQSNFKGTLKGGFMIKEAGIIPDPDLAAAVRATIGKPTGLLEEADLTPITHLEARNTAITSLAGLEFCAALESLDLSHNSIVDISPLAGLTNLTTLYLSNNQIADITPLTGLKNLTELFLAQNQIVDIIPLTGLTELRKLRLNGNLIISIGPISAGRPGQAARGLAAGSVEGLINLTELNLSDNKIRDIRPLANNQGLGSGDIVNLTNNPLDYNSVVVYTPQLRSDGVEVLSNALALVSINPNEATAGKVIRISELAGTDFAPGVRVSLKKKNFWDITATSIDVVNSNSLSCTFDLSSAVSGTWDVLVYNNSSSLVGALPDGFKISLEKLPASIQPSTWSLY